MNPTFEQQLEEVRPLLRDWLISLEIEAAMQGVMIMPSKTPKQAAAMRAAAAGKSTRGIPKKVGQEFVKADKAKGGRKK